MGMSFGFYLVTVIICWLIQRYVLKGNPNVTLSETFLILLFIPVANILVTLVFLVSKEKDLTPQWIIKNVYQIKD